MALADSSSLTVAFTSPAGLKVGDEVQVKITDIDFDRHRVSLSIRALLEEQKAAEDEAAANAPAEEVVYSTESAEPAEQPEEAPEQE